MVYQRTLCLFVSFLGIGKDAACLLYWKTTIFHFGKTTIFLPWKEHLLPNCCNSLVEDWIDGQSNQITPGGVRGSFALPFIGRVPTLPFSFSTSVLFSTFLEK